MSPIEFKAWRLRMGYTQRQAADALGLSKESVGLYDLGRRRGVGARPVEIPRPVELACAALAAGITRYVDHAA